MINKISHTRINEVEEAINNKWSSRYPHYSFEIEKIYILTYKGRDSVQIFDNVNEAKLTKLQNKLDSNRIYCISSVYYQICIVNKKDDRKHFLGTIHASLEAYRQIRFRKTGQYKRFVSRCIAEFGRQLPGLNLFEDLYSSSVKIVGSEYILHLLSGSKEKTRNIEHYMKHGTFKDAIVKSESNPLFEHHIITASKVYN